VSERSYRPGMAVSGDLDWSTATLEWVDGAYVLAIDHALRGRLSFYVERHLRSWSRLRPGVGQVVVNAAVVEPDGAPAGPRSGTLRVVLDDLSSFDPAVLRAELERVVAAGVAELRAAVENERSALPSWLRESRSPTAHEGGGTTAGS